MPSLASRFGLGLFGDPARDWSGLNWEAQF
jgi:hypothetical protein